MPNDADKMQESKPKTISVPDAGREYFGLAKDASYRAVKLGVIPVIKVGGKLRVPVIALERLIATAGQPKATS
jgi:hypothetical protein